MGTADKISNAIEDVAGKAKEAVGRLAGDRDLEEKGRKDQARGNVKKAGENVKDAAKNITGN